MAPKDLLLLPAPEAVRQVALNCLDQAAAACARLQDRADTEALHDFRVALRRLRSTLRAYRGLLGDCVPKKLYRRVRRLAGATNDARDAEVALAYVAPLGQRLAASARPGYDWLMQRLEDRRRSAYGRALDTIDLDFVPLEARLRERLRTDAEIEWPDPTSFAAEVGANLPAASDLLRLHLDHITSPADEAEAHQARIAGKRLRYLLEPIRSATPGAAASVRRLRHLQDLLGEIHDMQVLETQLLKFMRNAAAEQAEELLALTLAGATRHQVAARRRQDYRDGLLAAGAWAARHRTGLFRRLQKDFLNGGGDVLCDQVERLAVRLRGMRVRGG